MTVCDEENETTWHAMEPEEVLEQLDSAEEGLTDHEAGERREQYGSNELPRGKGESALSVLLRQIHNPLIYVLLAATVIEIPSRKSSLIRCS